ncbi:hypothetical protein F5887DRAFT_924103 [Amanita rubescens]|nr:hypothetical protein F5887DRAFT_924103 [Amanita rubescens]
MDGEVVIDPTGDGLMNGTEDDINENLAEMNGIDLYIVDSDEDDNYIAIRAEGKGKGREVTSETVPSTPSVEPALFISVHHPGVGYGRVVFEETRGYRALTALYFYQLPRSSHGVQLEEVNEIVDGMLGGLIRLATACTPIFIRDQKLLYSHPFPGFRHLSHWELQLNARDTTTVELVLEPVLDSEEKRRLLSKCKWAGRNSRPDQVPSSSMAVARDGPNASMASSSAASHDNDLIPEEYRTYIGNKGMPWDTIESFLECHKVWMFPRVWGSCQH